jgi:hypothetical protein
MATELTLDQARTIAGMRRRWPRADVRAHQRAWGVIVEVRRAGRTLAVAAFDRDGGITAGRPLPVG